MIAGQVVGSLAGGLLIGNLGYFYAFLASALSFAVGFAVSLAIREGTEVRGEVGEETDLLLAVCLATFLHFSGWGFFRGVGPAHLRDYFRVSETIVGMTYSIYALLQASTHVFAGPLADKMGRGILASLGATLCALSLMGMAFSGEFEVFLLFTTLYAIGTGILMPSMLAMAGTSGRALGIYGASEDLGLVVGPSLAGLIYESLGPSRAFLLCSLMAALSSCIALKFLRRRNRSCSRRQSKG